MRCPNCLIDNSPANTHCHQCGTALSAPSTRPKEVPIVCSEFTRSPLIILAVIAYTVYAVILTVNAVPALGNIPYYFLLVKNSIFLALSMILSSVLFVPVIFIVIGLWNMIINNGTSGAGMVSSSIKTYVSMNAAVLGCLFLAIITSGSAKAILSFAGSEFLFLVLIIAAFSLIAVSSLSRFAEAVGYTANYDDANTDGLVSCGTMVLIYAGLGLITLLLAGTANVTGSLTGGGADTTFASIMYVSSIILFGISVLVYNSRITQAEATDIYFEELDRRNAEEAAAKAAPKPPVRRPAYQVSAPAAAPVAASAPAANSDEKVISLLKQYKELLDTGVITQEEFDKKKSQLLK